MQNTTVRDRQNMVDMGVQVTGAAEGVLSLAVANNLSITDNVEGVILKNVEKINDDIAALYAREKLLPATSDSGCPGGIGCWAIEVDFIVS